MTGYSSFIDQISAAGPYAVSSDTSATPFVDTNVNAILPQMISYAERRIYREPELDFLGLYTTDTTQFTVQNNRLLAIPSSILIIDGINIITPAGSTVSTSGSERISLKRVNLNVLDFIWNASTGAASQGEPEYFAVWEMQQNSVSVRLAPTPDGVYQAEYLGTFMPDPLSSTNTDTFLTTYLPELFFAASMIFLSGYQRNFGQGADDPKMAMSWEAAYQGLKTGVAVNEARKHSRGPQWQPTPPAPLAAQGA